MRFSFSILTAAVFGSVAVQALPFGKCGDVSKVVLSESLLLDSANATNALAAPTSKLDKIILGVGTQNYTCVDGVPKPAGAYALLYDVSCAANPQDLSLIEYMTGVAVNLDPKGFHKGLQLFAKMLNLQMVAGTHYFVNDFTTPAFFFKDGSKFVGKVGNKVPALKTANKGRVPDANGAVPSLLLLDRGLTGEYKSTYKSVYRLYTAGGAATATCNFSGTRTFPYAAQYFFYK